MCHWEGIVCHWEGIVCHWERDNIACMDSIVRGPIKLHQK